MPAAAEGEMTAVSVKLVPALTVGGEIGTPGEPARPIFSVVEVGVKALAVLMAASKNTRRNARLQQPFRMLVDVVRTPLRVVAAGVDCLSDIFASSVKNHWLSESQGVIGPPVKKTRDKLRFSNLRELLPPRLLRGGSWNQTANPASQPASCH